MSTEHQQYSTENQGDKILEYAARRNIEIVRTYADEGKSGLRIDGRRALQQLTKRSKPPCRKPMNPASCVAVN
jgi:DNA invertase Pin-like site-specific DNA recombinase